MREWKSQSGPVHFQNPFCSVELQGKLSAERHTSMVFGMQKNFTACLFSAPSTLVPIEVCEIQRVLQRIKATASFLSQASIKSNPIKVCTEIA